MTIEPSCGSVGASQAGVPGADGGQPRDSLLESLRARERELAKAYRLTTLGTWRWLIPTDTVTWSEQVYRISGRNPEEPAPGYPAWRTMYTPESWERLSRAVERAVDEGVPYALDVELVRPDGSHRWVVARGEVGARGSGGSVIELCGTMQDIAEQVKTEAALRDTQSRFQRLYDASILGIAYADKSGGFSGGNDEFLRVIGYSREDLRAGRVRWDKLTPPEYRELDAQRIAEADEHGMCTPYEKEYIRKDGTLVPILCGYALLYGSTQEYIGFVIDLSIQKQSQQALREREQRFRELTEALPELVWVAGADGCSEYINQRFEQYTGVPVEALKGAARGVIHPDDREMVIVRWSQCVQAGEEYTNTLRLRRHDGAFRYFLARATPIRDSDGKVVRWLGTATDVHEQRLAEEALRRTEKLAATGRLAASIAHEINNPLAAVTNALYLAMQMEISDEAREYLEIAEQELARVAQVTTQTLSFHRHSTVAVLAEPAEIMDSAISLYASRLHSMGIALERRYRRRGPLLCYADELRQVFASLLSNSLDATRRGGRIVVHIRDGCDRSEGGKGRGVRITLADTGCGIGPEVRQHLFEPFVSTKGSTGTGLGLWVSDGIVRKHGGRISVRSRTRQPAGTVFALFLPLLLADPSLANTLDR